MKVTKVESFQSSDANELARAVTGFLSVQGREFRQLVAGLSEKEIHVVYLVYDQEANQI